MTDIDTIIHVSDSDLERLCVAGIDAEESGDIEVAISLYKIASSLGDLTSMTRLADILSEPPKFQDVTAAEKLYMRACLAGHAIACGNLAILYNQLGKSVLSQKYLNLAKSRGDSWED